MEELQKAQFRMTCLIEASKLKQNLTTAGEFKDKSVVEIAREFAEFVVLLDKNV